MPKFHRQIMSNIKQKQRILWTVFPFLLSAGKQFKSRFISALVLIGMSIIFNVALPVVMKEIISSFIKANNNFFYVIPILVSYVLIWLFSQLSMALRELYMFRVVVRGIKELCIRVVAHITKLPMRVITEQKVGWIVNVLDKAKDAFPNIFWGMFFYLIPTIIEIITAMVILYLYYGVTYISILFTILCCFALYTVRSSSQLARYQRLSNKVDAEFGSQIADCIINFESVYFFGQQDYERERLNKYAGKKEFVEGKVLEFGAKQNLMQSLIIGLGFVALTIISGCAVVAGKLHVGDFVLINGYLIQFVNPLKYLGTMLQNLRKSFTNMEQVIDLLDIKIEEINCINQKELVIDKNEIRFDNVSFGYDKKQLILKNISFRVQQGTAVAFVGETGAGKSTILKLLCRLYEPDFGQICIGKQNISNVTMDSLLKNIAIVPQDTILFNRSLKANIAYSNLAASVEEVGNVIRYAQLESLVDNLNKRLNYRVGERAVKLSGGERQRISIARAMLKNSKVLLLDEATSNLDIRTESQILKTLLNTNKGKTILIVAHRLSSLIDVDKIIFLHRGEIVEQGTHSELLELDGRYAKLWSMQQRSHYEINQ